jgi:hypothetical protein
VSRSAGRVPDYVQSILNATHPRNEMHLLEPEHSANLEAEIGYRVPPHDYFEGHDPSTINNYHNHNNSNNTNNNNNNNNNNTNYHNMNNHAQTRNFSRLSTQERMKVLANSDGNTLRKGTVANGLPNDNNNNNNNNCEINQHESNLGSDFKKEGGVSVYNNLLHNQNYNLNHQGSTITTTNQHNNFNNVGGMDGLGGFGENQTIDLTKGSLMETGKLSEDKMHQMREIIHKYQLRDAVKRQELAKFKRSLQEMTQKYEEMCENYQKLQKTRESVGKLLFSNKRCLIDLFAYYYSGK